MSWSFDQRAALTLFYWTFLRSTNKNIKNGKENDTIGKENDTIGKENDTIGKENNTIGKENDTTGKENDTIGKKNDLIGNEWQEINEGDIWEDERWSYIVSWTSDHLSCLSHDSKI